MEEKEEYKLPIVSQYVHDKALAKSINSCKYNAFVSLTNGNEINNIPFDENPNLLVYGIQGSGKSNFIENILINILLKSTPLENKIVIIDTKKLEYTAFTSIPHLYHPVINDPKLASGALQKIVAEIDRRYDLFSKRGVKSIEQYNLHEEKSNDKLMPNIYVVVDDLLDLVSKEIMPSIEMIALKGRQVGVYIIVGASNIDSNIINMSFVNMFSCRVCFRAKNARDSKLLLNKPGAETLEWSNYYYNSHLNKYDGEYKSYKIDKEDVRNLADYVIKQPSIIKHNNIMDLIKTDNPDSGLDSYDDPMYDEVVEYAIEMGKISASLIQRKFRFGFNRATRMIDLLESRGIVGPQNGSKPREVLIKLEEEHTNIEVVDNGAESADNDVGSIDNVEKYDENSEKTINKAIMISILIFFALYLIVCILIH